MVVDKKMMEIDVFPYGESAGSNEKPRFPVPSEQHQFARESRQREEPFASMIRDR